MGKVRKKRSQPGRPAKSFRIMLNRGKSSFPFMGNDVLRRPSQPNILFMCSVRRNFRPPVEYTWEATMREVLPICPWHNKRSCVVALGGVAIKEKLESIMPEMPHKRPGRTFYASEETTPKPPTKSQRLLMRLEKAREIHGKYIRVVEISTGKAYKVPTDFIVIHGTLKQEELHNYPPWVGAETTQEKPNDRRLHAENT